MFEEQLDLEEAELNEADCTSDLPIMCDLFPTCQDAVAFRQSEIESYIERTYEDAWNAARAQGEERPVAAAKTCFEDLAKSICNRAKSEGWPYCEGCGSLGIKW